MYFFIWFLIFVSCLPFFFIRRTSGIWSSPFSQTTKAANYCSWPWKIWCCIYVRKVKTLENLRPSVLLLFLFSFLITRMSSCFHFISYFQSGFQYFTVQTYFYTLHPYASNTLLQLSRSCRKCKPVDYGFDKTAQGNCQISSDISILT